ncbi:MAG: hypothetical protein ACREP4_12445 [Stenotrophomonas sp.]|uniref:hypothetical protein n=1 Tax=Stenotrophomonas sp. TaxID=69392 RepID=UPI003D6D4851
MSENRDRAIVDLHGAEFSEAHWAGLERVFSVVRSHFPQCDVYIAQHLRGNKKRIRIGRFGKKRGLPLFGINIDKDSSQPYFRVHIESKKNNNSLPPALGTAQFTICEALGVSTWSDLIEKRFYLNQIASAAEIDSYVAQFKKIPKQLLDQRTAGSGRMPAELETV